MQSKINIKDHYWIISYQGDMAELLPGPLPEVMQALKNGVHEIILDFASLKYLSQIGVKALKETWTVAKERAANIGVASPQPQVRRVIKLSGLFPALPIYENQADAVSKLDLVDYDKELGRADIPPIAVSKLDLVDYDKSAVKDMADRLLIIQKDKPIAGELRDAIRKHPVKQSYRMFPCRDIDRAGEILLEERIDCILVDCCFPLYQVAKFIENIHTDDRLQLAPILIVAGKDRLEQAEMLIRNGAHELLRYPFQTVEVVIRLQTMICHFKDPSPWQPPMSVEQPVGWKY